VLRKNNIRISDCKRKGRRIRMKRKKEKKKEKERRDKR